MAGEWSLAAFSLLGQLAVGIHLFIGGPLALGPAGREGAGGGRAALVAAVALAELGLMASATLVSFFHLHHPFRAYNVLRNLRRSWLSREIFFELAFMASLAALAVCAGKGIGTPSLVRGLYILGAVAGVLFVASMAGIYMRTSVPAWGEMHTPLSFGLAGLAMGAAAGAAFFRSALGRSDIFRLHAIAALLLVAACLIEAFALAPQAGVYGKRKTAGLRAPSTAARSRHAAGMALLFAGAVLLAGVLILAGPAAGGVGVAAEKAEFAILLGAFVLIVAGEGLGRVHFYEAGLSPKGSPRQIVTKSDL